MKKTKQITSQTTASKTEKGLNLQQENFCQAYTSQDKELFGNGAISYLKVYGEEYIKTHDKPMTYQVAVVNASRLLTNAKVIERINSLLEQGGFNDENVDKQHLFLINQHADLKTKLGAIREYNNLKKRVEQKITLTINPSDEDRTKSNEALSKFITK